MPTSIQLKSLATCSPDRQLTGARFSPAADMLIGGSFDGTLRHWQQSEAEWQEQPPLTGHQGWVTQVVFSADGNRLYSADSWGQLKCWERAESTWKEAWAHPQAHDGWLRQLALSPQGDQLASCGRDGCIRLWQADSGKLIHEHSQDVELFCVAWHPQEPVIVTGDLFGHVRVWSADGLKPLREFDATELFTEHRLQEVGGARQLAFDATGSTLAVAGTRPKNGGNVQGVPLALLFNWKSGERTEAFELGSTSDAYVTDMMFHPAEFLLAVTSGNPGTGQIVGMRSGEEKPFFIDKKLGNCHSLSLHEPSGKLAVTSTSKGSAGNGRRLDKEGNYAGNASLVTVFDFALSDAEPEK